MATQTYPTAIIARLFNKTPRHINRLAKDGVIPKYSDNQYELAPTVNAYIAHLEKIIEDLRDQKEGSIDSKENHDRLIKAKADIAEEEARRLQLQNAPIAIMQKWCNMMVSTIRQGVYTLPNILPPVIVGLSSQPEIKDEITKAIDHICRDLANPDLYSMAEVDLEREKERREKHAPK